jgi:hypothetical protein
MREVKFRQLQECSHSLLMGLHEIESVLRTIETTARAVEYSPDPDAALDRIALVARLGANRVEQNIDSMACLTDTIDDLNTPVVDMTPSALQAASIKNAVHALRQVIPDDQVDIIGFVNVVIRLADDLAAHLITGGRHKLLKEAFEAVVGGGE